MPRALLVGAGGGLGRALADVYARQGWTVQAVDRDTCDLADPASVSALGRTLSTTGARFDLCVVAAAAAEAGYVDQVPADAFQRCLQVNFLSPITLLAALAASAACRRFVLVLSGAADFLVPGLAPYALSKRALRDWVEIVRLEGSFPGVRILAVWPGAIDTDFNRKIRVHGTCGLPRGSRPRPAREVAELIYRAEQAGRARLVLSPLPSLLGRLQALAPALVRRLIRRHPELRRRR